MRRRLLLVLLGFSLAAVVGFAVPLLNTTAASRTQQFVLSRTADVTRFGALARDASSGGDRTQLVDEVRAHAELFDDGVVVVDANRQAIVETGMRATEPEVTAAIDAALRNQPSRPPADLRPWSDGTVLFGQPIGTGTRVTGAVVLRSSIAPAVSDITTRWLIVLLAAIAATGACVLLAVRLSRWALRPVQQLTDGVRKVAAGQERTHVNVHAGPAELRGLGDSFNQMSDALAESADRQRRLVADASHQLRNPMAALRLRIDTIAARDDGQSSGYDSMVRELERLEALLDGMLALASADSKATELAAGGTDVHCDAFTVLLDRIEVWRAAAASANVRLHGPENEPAELPVACTDSELAQVMDVVLDNAIKYAGAGATVRASCSSEPDGTHLVVADDGPGVPDAELHRLTERFWRSAAGKDLPGSGLGLAIADRLVTARGGTFSVRNRAGSGLEVSIGLNPAERV